MPDQQRYVQQFKQKPLRKTQIVLLILGTVTTSSLLVTLHSSVICASLHSLDLPVVSWESFSVANQQCPSLVPSKKPSCVNWKRLVKPCKKGKSRWWPLMLQHSIVPPYACPERNGHIRLWGPVAKSPARLPHTFKCQLRPQALFSNQKAKHDTR